MAKGARAYAAKNGFRISNVPRNQTKLRAKYKYVIRGGSAGRSGPMYARTLREAENMLRMGARTQAIIERRRAARSS
jgi:hypothetical protein